MLASRFEATLADHGVTLRRNAVTTLQVNVGKRCNQACHHCHVDAGPKRTEMMAGRTFDRLLELLAAAPQVTLVDITGGAPELNPHFREFVKGVRKLDRRVIDRCNLTILEEPGQEDLGEFLAGAGVEIVASLPCYLEDNVNAQRGSGVFAKSISALKKLNTLGYGERLPLDLVYNPVGAHLPPAQAALEADYKRELAARYGVTFSRLYTITNMPIARYAHALKRDGKLQDYMELLIASFNVSAAETVMCRDLISVSWDGSIYDCDFNQMLEIPAGCGARTVFNIDHLDAVTGAIALGDHCYGCTAGAGSSCGGALIA